MGNIFTGDNFATNKSSTVIFNDKKRFSRKLETFLNLPLELGYGVITGIVNDDSENPSGVKVSLSRRNNNLSSTVSDPIIAFPLSKDIIKMPLINETVLCIKLPITLGPGTSEQWYYFSDINVFNDSNNNLVGGITYDRKGPYFGETYSLPEKGKEIPNVKLFEGDTIFQGRFGNKIRFGSTNLSSASPSTLNDWSVGGSSGSPITIISNGGGDLENLDEDPSSIYLTSNQSLPIYLQSPTPKTLTSLEQYSENSQVVIASDKLVFYTKDGIGDIIISGIGTSYLMGEKVHLATNEWSNIDVTTLMDLIEGLVDQLKALTSGQATFSTGMGPTGPASNAAEVLTLKTDLALLKG